MAETLFLLKKIVSLLIQPLSIVLVLLISGLILHMPRSMALFHKLGMDPIPAPTEYIVVRQSHVHPRAFFPVADSLHKMEAAIHEYMGLIWMHIQ
ncbi:MAG: hypothetical protein WC405_02235 [Syntrophales bacterium]